MRVSDSSAFVMSEWKEMFFDSPAVIRALQPKIRAGLSRFGAFTRTDARRSIKKRLGPSKPGTPPHSHAGNLRRGIYFGLDKKALSVVIGPVKYPMANNVPSTLEYGGSVSRHRNKRRKVRRVGDSGVIVIGRRGISTKQVKDRNDKLRWATFAQLKTEAQVQRSMRLEEEVWGPLFIGGRVQKRPFMRPSFDRQLAMNPPSFV